MNAPVPQKSDVIPLTPENLAALMERPLLAVPVELRLAVWNLWTINQHFFSTPLAISSAIATDLSHGLTISDAQAILSAMAHPEERAKFKFASDYAAELARRTSLAISQREKMRKQLERRREMNGTPAQPNAAMPIIEAIARGFR